MTSRSRFLTAGAAARQLGITAKALRIYEQHGLISPGRTASGWRCYDAPVMDRVREIVQLRTLGFGLAEIGAILVADPASRETILKATTASASREATSRGDTSRNRGHNRRPATGVRRVPARPAAGL